jgi:two-component system, OmpR family, sensor histidine kinase CpxA
MIRTIYGKIFAWFWVATVGVAASVTLITLYTGAQPLGRRWMSRVLDYYARSAVDFYQHGGKAQVQDYFADIDRTSGIHAALVDLPSGTVLAGTIPEGTEWLLKRSRATGKSQFYTGLRWSGVSVVHRTEGDFILVAQVLPLRGLFNPSSVGALLLRISIGLLSAGLLCLILARHIAGPIRSLQTAAGRIANGDLSVRALPSIGGRNDELADLANDFDRMAERIEALLQKQHELLGDISHELRSPLARLGVSLELVRRGERDGIERMQTDLDRLDAMIGQILTLTRLQGTGNTKSEASLNLRSIIESVVEDARLEGKEEDKSIVISHADDCQLRGDAALLRSCIENVVRNAIRYTKPQTAVSIELRRKNAPGFSLGLANIVIADNGEGVPPDALPRLFEPFYRVSSARDRNTGGTGLGLSIAQRVVLFHGGSITARNRDGGGLEMEIRLPLHQS